MKQEIFFFMIIISVFIQTYSKKQIIGNHFSNLHLEQSKFQIIDDQVYSITFWFRILTQSLTIQDSIMFEIRNDIGQFLQFIVKSNTIIYVKDDNLVEIPTNIPTPFCEGKIDLEHQVVFYDEWSPIVISKDQINTINIKTFPDVALSLNFFKDFTNVQNTFIDFNPVQTQKYEIHFENVIYRDILINTNDMIYSYIFNNGHLGMYFIGARSKNETILYNLNQSNEFKNYHIYLERINPNMTNWDDLVSTYNLYMPNFFDSRVFYICQYMFFQRFTINDNPATRIMYDVNKQYLYYRSFSYDNTYFTFYLEMIIDISNTTTYDFNQALYVDFNGSIQLIKDRHQSNFDQNTWVREEKYQIALFIYSYPTSSHTRFCSIKLVGTHDNLQTNFQSSNCYNYSYYDQIKLIDDSVNITKHVYAVLLSRIVFYRDIHDNVTTDPNQTDRFFVSFDKDEKVKFNFQLLLTKKHQFLNFDVNSFTELIDFADYNTNYSAYVCTMISPGCDFCINFKCVRCKQRYQLIDGYCLKCEGNYTLFRNKCIKTQYKVNFNNYSTLLTFESNKLKLLDVRIKHFKIKLSNVLSQLRNQFFLQSDIHLQEFYKQIQSYMFTSLLVIDYLEVYYVHEFSTDDYAICDPNTYYQTDQDFFTKCFNQCPLFQHIEQKRFCLDNIEGCEIQTQTQCTKCKADYIQELLISGKIICLAKKIYPSDIFQTQYRQYDKTTTVPNCSDWTSDGKCLICNTGYMINTIDQQCILVTNEFNLKDSDNLCTIYDNPNTPVNCIGTYSSSYVLNDTILKWTVNCSINVYFQSDCTSCSNDYHLTSIGTCEQCLLYDSNTTSCTQCPAEYQIYNNECRESTCLKIIDYCNSCDLVNLLLCTNCIQGYILVYNNYYQECIVPLEGCDIHVYQQNQYTCSQCLVNYFSLDESFNINSTVKFCVQQIYEVLNCIQYLQEGVDWFCALCQVGYNLNITTNFCDQLQILISNCLNFDSATNDCFSCTIGYECLDNQYFVSQSICSICMPITFQITNCLQYNADFVCTQCLLNHFLVTYQNIQQCIHDNYFVQDCIQYQGTDAQGYICITCKDNSTPQNNVCINQTQQNQIAEQSCIKYNEKQDCLECIQNFYLIQLKINNDIIFECFEDIIQNCEIYQNQIKCFKCYDNFILNQSQKQCYSNQNMDQFEVSHQNDLTTLYSQLIQNCLVIIDFCQDCDDNDFSQCQICQENYYLSNNKCQFNCNEYNTQDQQSYQSNCLSQIQIQTIDQICENVYQNCMQCAQIQNVLKCILCNTGFTLQNDKCYKQTQLQQQKSCLFPCISCNDQSQCISCSRGFFLQKNICIIDDTNKIKLECLKQISCFQQDQIVNQHCSNCEKQCEIQQNNNILYLQEDIILKTKIEVNLDNVYIDIDHLNNQILIQSKNLLSNNILILNNFDFIYQTFNCTPNLTYKFIIQNKQIDTQNLVLQKKNESDTYLPLIVSVIPNSVIENVYFIVLKMKIYEYLEYLNINWGKLGETYKFKLKQNLQTEQDDVIKQYFLNQIDYQFIFNQYQIRTSFFVLITQMQIIELLFFIFCIIILTLKFFKKISERQQAKQKRNIKDFVFKYFSFKVFQIMINMLNQVTIFIQFLQQQYIFKSIYLIILLFISYICHTVIIKYIYAFYQLKRQIKSKRKHKQKLIIKREQKLKSTLEVINMFFLFTKLKFLFDLQNSSFTNLIIFIVINVLEIIKYLLYKNFEFLTILFVFEYISSISIVLFCSFSYTLKNFQIVKQYSQYQDWIFILTIITHFLQFLVNSLVFKLRQNKLSKNAKNMTKQYIFIQSFIAYFFIVST